MQRTVEEGMTTSKEIMLMALADILNEFGVIGFMRDMAMGVAKQKLSAMTEERASDLLKRWRLILG